MIDSLWSLLDGNQFLSGGLLLGALGTGLVLLRRYVALGLTMLWKHTTITVEVRSTDAAFDWLVLWLDQQPYARRARRLTVAVAPRDRNQAPTATMAPTGSGVEQPRIMFSPSPGSHFFVYARRLVWLRRERHEANEKNFFEREDFTLTVFARSQAVLRTLLEDAYQAYAALMRDQSRIYTSAGGYGWRSRGLVRPRPLDSIILPGDEKAVLLADVQRFLASEPWYHAMGIPFRRGYLLHGVAGSGKSSLVAALAGELGLHLFVLNLNGTSDGALTELLANISAPRAIVLFEDIDCVAAARETGRTGEKDLDREVTIGGLLNALDGVGSRDGCITILTTNYRDQLDPALIRPGRIDLEVAFGYATPGQAVELYRRFYGPEATVHHRDHLMRALRAETSMATLQEHFLRHRDDPAAGAALEHLVAESRGFKVVAS